MKKMPMVAGLLVLAAGATALGVSQHMSFGDKTQTVDAAAGAIAVVADAANRMTSDNGAYTITVTTRVGQARFGERDQQAAVETEIGVRGGAGLANVCASLPRIRDTINGVVTDRIGPWLRSGRTVPGDEFVADGHLILASLNRMVQNAAVTDVRLVLKPIREVQDGGCNDRGANASAAAAPRARE
jgi:hypothetical protein